MCIRDSDNRQALNLIFNGGSIDILQQEIVAGEQFTNPFSTRNDATVQVYDHMKQDNPHK